MDNNNLANTMGAATITAIVEEIRIIMGIRGREAMGKIRRSRAFSCC